MGTGGRGGGSEKFPVSISDIAAEVENDRRESVMKLAQAHDVSVKRFTLLVTRICLFQEVVQLSAQTSLQGDCFAPSPRRPSEEYKRMVVELTHGLFIT